MTTGFVIVLVLTLAELPLSQQTELPPLMRGVLPFRHGHPGFLNDPRARLHFMSKLRRQTSLSPLVSIPPVSSSQFSPASSFQPSLPAAAAPVMPGISFIGIPIDRAIGVHLPDSSPSIDGFPGFIDISNGNPSDLDINDNVHILDPFVGNIGAHNELTNIGFGSNRGTTGPVVSNSGPGFHQRLSSDLNSILNGVPNIMSVSVGTPNSVSRQNNGQGMINTASRDSTGINNNIHAVGTHGVNVGRTNAVPSDMNTNLAVGRDMLTPTITSSTNSDGVQLFHTPLAKGGNLIELVLPQIKPTGRTGSAVIKPDSNGNPKTESLIPVQQVVNFTDNIHDLKPLAFESSATFPDTAISGIDITPIAITSGMLADASNGGTHGSNPVSQVLVQDTSFLTAHAYDKIPLNGNIFDQGIQPLANNILQPVTKASNSSELQTVILGMGKIKNNPTQVVSSDIYNPFNKRLKPEAFGPGPYYECSPPARVVCGARIGWDHVTGMTTWCKSNCVVFNYSSYCDDDRCSCKCVETKTVT